jgi:hypothetical protein
VSETYPQIILPEVLIWLRSSLPILGRNNIRHDILLHRNNIIREYFKEICPPDKIPMLTNTIGHSENNFYSALSKYFPDRVYKDFGLKYRELNNHDADEISTDSFDVGHEYYVPDITYFDREKNILIDIEIDEPYIYSNGEPIHFIENEKDILRNNFFSDNCWIVIRFAEEQVINNTLECIETIKMVLESIFIIGGDLEYVHYPLEESILLYEKEWIVRRWNEQEAINMAKEKYRDTYLYPETTTGFVAARKAPPKF